MIEEFHLHKDKSPSRKNRVWKNKIHPEYMKRTGDKDIKVESLQNKWKYHLTVLKKALRAQTVDKLKTGKCSCTLL